MHAQADRTGGQGGRDAARGRRDGCRQHLRLTGALSEHMVEVELSTVCLGLLQQRSAGQRWQRGAARGQHQPTRTHAHTHARAHRRRAEAAVSPSPKRPRVRHHQAPHTRLWRVPMLQAEWPGRARSGSQRTSMPAAPVVSSRSRRPLGLTAWMVVLPSNLITDPGHSRMSKRPAGKAWLACSTQDRTRAAAHILKAPYQWNCWRSPSPRRWQAGNGRQQ